MAFRGDLEALILGALATEPLHGYGIVRRIRESGGAGRLSEGQLYPLLHRMEDAGLVQGEWRTDTGAAPRKTYRITPEGVAELEKARQSWARFVSGVGSLLSFDSAEVARG